MRRRWVIVTGAAVVIAAASVLWVSLGGGAPSFDYLRLARPQEIPGSLGFVLEPPPDGFEPAVSPDRAKQIAAASAGSVPKVTEALASVPAALLGTGGEREVAVWVLVARRICYFDNKGDLVSSARSASAQQELPTCSRKNLSVVLVDARAGKTVGAVRGYDLSGAWKLAVAGS